MKKLNSTSILCFLLLIIGGCFASRAKAQELSQLTTSPWGKLKGGVSTQMDLSLRNKEFQAVYFFNGQLTPKIFGIDVPLSFTYSNQNLVVTQPFNRLCLQPSYKWVKTMFGTVSTSFSPYSLNGHLFNGAAVEVTPTTAFQLTAIYGKFKNAVAFDENKPEQEVSFKRIGWGVKTTFRPKKNEYGISVFHAKDQASSIENFAYAHPKENTVITFSGQLSHGEKIKTQFSFASNFLTQNTALEQELSAADNSGLQTLFRPKNLSTSIHHACKISFGYEWINLAYERVSPDYETLGSYYTNHDFENITLQLSKAFQQVQLAGSFGFEHNDLKKERMSKTQRIVGSFNGQWEVNKKLRLHASYSNFSSYIFQKPFLAEVLQENQLQNFDTLNIVQIAQNLNAGMSYQLSEDSDGRQQLSYQCSFQQSKANSGEVNSCPVHFLTQSAQYLISKKSGQSWGVGLQSNIQSGNTKSTHLGGNFQYGQLFFNKKLKTKATFSYYHSNSGAASKQDLINLRLLASYSLQKKHQFGCQFGQSLVFSKTKNNNPSTTLSINYAYQF